MSEKERPPRSRDEGSVTPERTEEEDQGAGLIHANDTGHGDTLPRPNIDARLLSISELQRRYRLNYSNAQQLHDDLRLEAVASQPVREERQQEDDDQSRPPSLSPSGRDADQAATITEAHGYLSRLFVHYAPECKPLPSLLGVVSQIDNLLVSLTTADKAHGSAPDVLSEASASPGRSAAPDASSHAVSVSFRDQVTQAGMQERFGVSGYDIKPLPSEARAFLAAARCALTQAREELHARRRDAVGLDEYRDGLRTAIDRLDVLLAALTETP